MNYWTIEKSLSFFVIFGRFLLVFCHVREMRVIMVLVNRMTINIGTITVNYIQYGEGEDVVLLHGWGQNIQMMDPLGKKLVNKRVTILDLPGFGETNEPDFVFDVHDYTEFLHEFLKQVQVKKPILIGHSFGGRIAICYAAKYPVEKLILFGAPCIREEVKPSLKVKVLKTLKTVPGLNRLSEVAKKFIGSSDYRNATPRMRDILVKVVNEDLSKEAAKISVPTLLIWGSEDVAAPVEDAKKMESLMKDAALIVLDGYTHYAYLEALPRVVSILEHFI